LSTTESRPASIRRTAGKSYVLESVVAVNKAAVVQAVDLQSPERAVRLQLIQAPRDLGRRQPVVDVGGEPLDRFEVAPDHPVHPEQLLEQRVRLQRLLGHRGEPSGCPAARRA
jgi:hypothetical protein